MLRLPRPSSSIMIILILKNFSLTHAINSLFQRLVMLQIWSQTTSSTFILTARASPRLVMLLLIVQVSLVLNQNKHREIHVPTVAHLILRRSSSLFFFPVYSYCNMNPNFFLSFLFLLTFRHFSFNVVYSSLRTSFSVLTYHSFQKQIQGSKHCSGVKIVLKSSFISKSLYHCYLSMGSQWRHLSPSSSLRFHLTDCWFW